MPGNTSLEQALVTLRGQQAIIAAAERISGFGTYLVDLQRDEAIWSAQLRHIFGIAEGDDVPVKLADLLDRVHPDDRRSFEAALRVVRDHGGRREQSFRIILPDGLIRFLRGWGELVALEGWNYPILIGTVQDVTGQVLSERVIREQAVALETLHAELLYQTRQSAMGTMAATLAHELNQPLTAISFFSSAAERMMEKGRIDRLGEMLSSIRENAQRAGEIIRRMRDSVASGRPKGERFTCTELVEEALRFSSIGCDSVHYDLSLVGVEIVGADRVQIQQVLVNLVRNACQAVAGHPEPKVCIETAVLDGPEPLFRLTVADNGPGVPSDLLPKIFEGGHTTKEQGMGLGLSISRTIIEKHNGRLWAENTSEGARFGFDIPLQGAVDLS